MVKDLGQIDECSVCYHPKNGKHLGIAKVKCCHLYIFFAFRNCVGITLERYCCDTRRVYSICTLHYDIAYYDLSTVSLQRVHHQNFRYSEIEIMEALQ